jgi:hypothetical protein
MIRGIRVQGERYQTDRGPSARVRPAGARFWERLVTELAAHGGAESVGLISTPPTGPQVSVRRLRIIGRRKIQIRHRYNARRSAEAVLR